MKVQWIEVNLNHSDWFILWLSSKIKSQFIPQNSFVSIEVIASKRLIVRFLVIQFQFHSSLPESSLVDYFWMTKIASQRRETLHAGNLHCFVTFYQVSNQRWSINGFFQINYNHLEFGLCTKIKHALMELEFPREMLC